MKILLSIIFLLAGWQRLTAQTAAEFFKQRKTQQEYLLAQIAALQSYIGLAEKGYAITRDGLGFIGGIKNGTFSLHKNYFSSLKTVGTAIKKEKVLGRAIILQASIASFRERSIHQLSGE